MEACLDALASPDEAVADSARSALRDLGPTLLSTVVSVAPATTRPQAWHALGDFYLSLDPSGALSALEAARSAWPVDRVSNLDGLCARLRVASERLGTQLEAILAPLRRSSVNFPSEEAGRDLQQFGRPAIPILLRELEHGVYRKGVADEAAAAALAELIDERDVQRVARLLREGHLLAAPVLREVQSAAARDALVEPLGAGIVSGGLLVALRPYAHSEEVMAATEQYLERISREKVPDNAGIVAGFAQRNHYYFCVPLLEELLEAASAPVLRWHLATALVRLGHRDAIPVLIEIHRDSKAAPSVRDTVQSMAGQTLNWVVHARVAPWPGDRASHARSARVFQKWWVEHGSTAEFDLKYQAWFKE